MRFGPFWVYTISLIVATAGLWAVLAGGSHLTAVQDFSGAWTLRPLDGERTGGAASGQLRIEQSGQFMRLFADDGQADVRLVDAGTQGSAKPRFVLGGGKVLATFEPIEMPDVWKLTLVGLEPGVYRATRGISTAQSGQEAE